MFYAAIYNVIHDREIFNQKIIYKMENLTGKKHEKYDTMLQLIHFLCSLMFQCIIQFKNHVRFQIKVM